nr:MAG TPA: hypothetical protein [Caudoviricetes sp.]
MKLVIIVLLVCLAMVLMSLGVILHFNLNRFLDLLEKRINDKKEDEYNALLATANVEKSRELMDSLVKVKLIEWQVYNSNPKTENYMSQNEIDDAIKYIIKRLCMEMTPALKLQLGFGYPMDTLDSMVESIKNRAMLIVLEYSIQQNTASSNSRMMKVFSED